MILLVCGGRHYEDKARVASVLADIHARTPLSHLIHGQATGADMLAASWAANNGIQPVACPALWEYYRSMGRPGAAGPARNKAMLALRPGAVVAFPGGAGTANMVAAAKAAGVRCCEVP